MPTLIVNYRSTQKRTLTTMPRLTLMVALQMPMTTCTNVPQETTIVVHYLPCARIRSTAIAADALMDLRETGKKSVEIPKVFHEPVQSWSEWWLEALKMPMY